MSHSIEKASARSGRLLLGAIGLLLVCLGISQSSNINYKTQNNGLKREIAEVKGNLEKETAHATKLTSDLKTAGAQIASLTTTLHSREADIAKQKRDIKELDSKLEATRKE